LLYALKVDNRHLLLLATVTYNQVQSYWVNLLQQLQQHICHMHAIVNKIHEVICKQYSRLAIKFTPYNMRHCSELIIHYTTYTSSYLYAYFNLCAKQLALIGVKGMQLELEQINTIAT